MSLLRCWATSSPRLPDKPWSWFVCGVCTLSVTIIIGIVYTYAAFLPVFMVLFNDSSIEELSAVGAISQMLVFFCFPLCYKIIGIINFSRGAVLSALLCSCSLLVTSFIEKHASILFITFSIPFGFGSSMMYTSCLFATTKYFKKKQNLAIGIVMSGISLGVLILTPLIQVLLDHFGLKTTFWILSGTVFSVILPVIVVMDTNVKDSTVSMEDQEERQAKSCFVEYFKIFKRPAYVITLVTIFLQSFTSTIVYVYLVKYCMVTGLTAQQGANQFIVIGVMSLVSSILAGRIMDNKTVNPFHVNQAAALVMATSLFLTQLANEYYHFMIFSAVFGSGVGAYYTTMEVLYINTGNKKLLKYAWPTAETLPSIGKGVGPPFIGLIIDVSGSYKTGFTTAAGIMMLSFLIPFLQYCFKPWREKPQLIEVTISPFPNEVEEKDQGNLPSSNHVNFGYNGTELEEKSDLKTVNSECRDSSIMENNNDLVITEAEDTLFANKVAFDTKF